MENMLELNGKPSSVIMFSIDFAFQNLFFTTGFAPGFQLMFAPLLRKCLTTKPTLSMAFQQHQKGTGGALA